MRWFLALALLLGGCGPAPDGSRSRTLVIWEKEDAQVAPFIDALFSEFARLPGNEGVKIVRTHYHPEDLRQQFQTAAIAGSAPDLIMSPSDNAGIFSISGFILPVDELFDLTLYLEPAREAVSQGGKTWGVPISNGNHLMLFHNKTLAPKAPESTAELFEACARLKGRLKHCLALNLAEPFWLMPWLGAYGGWPMQERTPTLNTPAMRGAIDFLLDIVYERKLAPDECDYNCADVLFKEGKVAFIINGDWSISSYQEKFGKDLGVAKIPKLSKTGRWPSPMLSGSYFMLSSDLKGEKLELARRLVSFYTNEKNQVRQVEQLKRLPALSAATKAKIIRQDPILAASMSQVLVGKPMPMALEMRAIWDAVRPSLGKALVRRIPVAEAAVRMQLDAEEKIREMTD